MRRLDCNRSADDEVSWKRTRPQAPCNEGRVERRVFLQEIIDVLTQNVSYV